MSGLVCGKRLAELGCSVTIFDTGKHAAGGRMSSRILNMKFAAGKAKNAKVDHSTQFFTATDPKFTALVEEWEKNGVVQEWKGPVGVLDKGSFTGLAASSKLWVGVGGIDAIARHLSKSLRVELDTWVAVVERQEDGKWRLFRDNMRRRRLSSEVGRQSDFDYIVVAHNGKCAERLMRDAEVPALHRLLKCKFSNAAPPKDLMQLSSLWVLAFAVEGTLGLPFEGAFVKNHPDLCWVSDNTRKLATPAQREKVAEGGYETWTVISSRNYGTRNKVPQEAIPEDVEERIVDELLRAFESSAGLKNGSIRPIARRVQLWGAGVPMNAFTGGPCVLDRATASGICGDWLIEPSVQGAALSGLAMAEAIVGDIKGTVTSDLGIPEDLRGCFAPAPAPACGAFPGLEVGDFNPPEASRKPLKFLNPLDNERD
ncbi:hypothetical protein GUITHDRAFT_106844 [Guillardia theta CCMP2712]|uniref:Amine oxidase domain-containing protein n=1 Tax=Guillardia theta (strain CCMP2712) TaxID=905079 RepID=L1JGY2_GUITC|nr:hypothetical protein GUITHDRAFT_106844 [Guillardia theta CCMP2712]EKX47399.1 hypothetical protein GUITHDRAFT_106844 [Guillardia theta CCMP2712]|eukprot:XP_005834379.1 hypothetical protein GUITHDRAFT_106844 [Guillardia theta CCMP2712]